MSEEVKLKVNVPLFEEKELEIFDNNIHNIAKEYCEMHLKEKDQILTQRLIKMLEDENNKQKEVLDKIKEYLEEDDWTSVNGVIAVKLIKEKLNDLLEEIE